MRKLFFLAFLFASFQTFSQEQEQATEIEISGFLDLYYGYDFSYVQGFKRHPFLYNHSRHNQFNVNLALLTGGFKSGRFRATLGLQQGTYAQDNLIGEPKAYRWINQANVGFALNSNRTLWLDAGVLPSHIGSESAVSRDNLTLSRSLTAENSPYFETGFRLGWDYNEKWYFALLVINGWQRIQGIEGKSDPSFGTQMTYKPDPNTTLNWSTFLGTNKNREALQERYFSNLYGNFSLGNRWKMISGLHLGYQSEEGKESGAWWGFSAIAQYNWTTNFATALRIEHYNDPKKLIAETMGNYGLQRSGISLNLDRKIGQFGVFRIEGRYLSPNYNLEVVGVPFPDNESLFLLSSFSVWFN